MSELIIVTPARNEYPALENRLHQQILDDVPDNITPRLLIVANNSEPEFVEKLYSIASSSVFIHNLGDIRPRPFGYAYIKGFEIGLSQFPQADFLLEMDFTNAHNPKHIPDFLKCLEDHQAAFSTRFSHGGSIQGYPLTRRLNSQLGTFVTNLVFGWQGRQFKPDMTSGYEAWTTEIIRRIIAKHPPEQWLSATSLPGYMIQTEARLYTYQETNKVGWVPITWGTDRYKQPNSIPLSTSLKALLGLLQLKRNIHYEK